MTEYFFRTGRYAYWLMQAAFVTLIHLVILVPMVYDIYTYRSTLCTDMHCEVAMCQVRKKILKMVKLPFVPLTPDLRCFLPSTWWLGGGFSILHAPLVGCRYHIVTANQQFVVLSRGGCECPNDPIEFEVCPAQFDQPICQNRIN